MKIFFSFHSWKCGALWVCQPERSTHQVSLTVPWNFHSSWKRWDMNHLWGPKKLLEMFMELFGSQTDYSSCSVTLDHKGLISDEVDKRERTAVKWAQEWIKRESRVNENKGVNPRNKTLCFIIFEGLCFMI